MPPGILLPSFVSWFTMTGTCYRIQTSRHHQWRHVTASAHRQGECCVLFSQTVLDQFLHSDRTSIPITKLVRTDLILGLIIRTLEDHMHRIVLWIKRQLIIAAPRPENSSKLPEQPAACAML